MPTSDLLTQHVATCSRQPAASNLQLSKCNVQPMRSDGIKFDCRSRTQLRLMIGRKIPKSKSPSQVALTTPLEPKRRTGATWRIIGPPTEYIHIYTYILCREQAYNIVHSGGRQFHESD